MNLYYKYYTADIIKGGVLVGNIVTSVPFYKSALQAMRIMKTTEYFFINFRRVD